MIFQRTIAMATTYICAGFCETIMGYGSAVTEAVKLAMPQIAPSWFLQFARLLLRKMQALQKNAISEEAIRFTTTFVQKVFKLLFHFSEKVQKWARQRVQSHCCQQWPIQERGKFEDESVHAQQAVFDQILAGQK